MIIPIQILNNILQLNRDKTNIRVYPIQIDLTQNYTDFVSCDTMDFTIDVNMSLYGRGFARKNIATTDLYQWTSLNQPNVLSIQCYDYLINYLNAQGQVMTEANDNTNKGTFLPYNKKSFPVNEKVRLFDLSRYVVTDQGLYVVGDCNNYACGIKQNIVYTDFTKVDLDINFNDINEIVVDKIYKFLIIYMKNQDVYITGNNANGTLFNQKDDLAIRKAGNGMSHIQIGFDMDDDLFVPHFVQGGNLQKYSNGASITVQKNVNSFYFDESSSVNQKQDTQNIVMVMADKIFVRNFKQSRYDALKLYCVLNPQNAHCQLIEQGLSHACHYDLNDGSVMSTDEYCKLVYCNWGQDLAFNAVPQKCQLYALDSNSQTGFSPIVPDTFITYSATDKSPLIKSLFCMDTYSNSISLYDSGCFFGRQMNSWSSDYDLARYETAPRDYSVLIGQGKSANQSAVAGISVGVTIAIMIIIFTVVYFSVKYYKKRRLNKNKVVEDVDQIVPKSEFVMNRSEMVNETQIVQDSAQLTQDEHNDDDQMIDEYA
ncbi:Regulator_of chromosome condensation 1/beta-lactamase-inhibitor protein II [Hexamita inflata]|uniref:Regulator of chromosome condensation 1/beta-lactamase-inhibitor protein II n=1 Tax=Hexamita inflata TaxID=28002 RepID=A0AA86NZI9_9EUKA|nr:Regulator of chromosome condensation 1/beta-lactamase-inhibitor protein II [Hexamita inflata]